MQFEETLIKEYAKKIFGFAYSKTNNYYSAEDLSQNILLALLEINFENKEIVDMDGYIYRVCQYTWSNFIRKNKPHWEGMRYIDEMQTVISDENFENRIIQDELYQKLRREIMYLSKIKREITILFYYESKSGDEISKLLGIPSSTVRWYLGVSKKILKERIKMSETVYIPKKLTIYFCGNSTDFSLHGLRNDLLVQNICFVCREKALSIEEIASTLGMAAPYVEDKIEPLINMDYIRKVGNKYQTNFFIKDEVFFVVQKKFEYENLPSLGKEIFNVVKDNLSTIQQIGFTGAELDENFLLWALVAKVAHDLLCDISLQVMEPPIRGDGSRHWIDAGICEEDILKACTTIDDDIKDYILYSGGFGAKHSGNEWITAQQFDMKFAGPWRGFFNNEVIGVNLIHKTGNNIHELPIEIYKKM